MPPSLKKLMATHTAGWEPWAVVVVAALLAALLLVPRPSRPETLPLPLVDEFQLRRSHEEARARGLSHLGAPLPYRVRALGTAIRKLARAEVEDQWDPLDLVGLEQVRERTLVARREEGDGPVLSLRDLQTELFLRALADWERTGERSADLIELGGTFVDTGYRNRWILDGRKIVSQSSELTVLFHVRWANLTGLTEVHPYAPTLDEWRIYYRFLLRHPEQAREASEQGRRLVQLTYVAGLQQRDPTYPVLLAKGILHLGLEDFRSAAVELTAFTASPGAGPWYLRARCYLAAAVAQGGPLSPSQL